ncbi:MAG: Gfo/Idh/MocA family oxidoreductase [Chloroflexota bacterium]|nr:Gfo/Idh/MocA family oxidoreductase [Chloroflexota bacterium]
MSDGTAARAPLGIGIVGCGTIARTHLRALLQFPAQMRVVALASRSPASITGAADYLRARAEELVARAETDGTVEQAALYREHARAAPTAYSEYAALVDDPSVDAVIVTTPPFLHHPVALAALRAGRHVLSEKPLAVSLREADAMIEAARAHGLVLATVSQGRFADEQRRMKALVKSGKLGDVFFGKADTQWIRPPTYYEVWWRGTWSREGGGAATGQGIHLLDQALWIIDKRPARVYGRIGTFVHPVPRQRAEGGVPIEDTALGIVTFADGSMLELAAAVTHHLEKSQLELYGERGSVYAYPWTLFSVDDAVNAELARFVAEDVPPLPDAWVPKAREVDPYQRPGQNALPVWSMIPQVGDFLDAVLTGREALTGGAEGRRALEVLTGLYASAIEEQEVALPLDPDNPYYDGVAAGLAARSA